VTCAARLAVVLSLGAVGARCAPETGVVHLSTTTSVDNSGLLAAMVPAFEAAASLDVRVVAGGSGRALAILARGDSDVALTHDPAAEQALLDRGVVDRYRKVMFNDFVIAGPPNDPAGVRGAAGSLDAMRRIAASASPFASRADSSGTHSRELRLWDDAGVRPSADALLETGSGQAATLRVASERRAYALTDRATFRQVDDGLRLAVLHEGDPSLVNTYAVMTRAGLDGARRAAANRLFDWLTDGAGRDRIAAFRIDGEPAFTIWPAGAPRDRAADLPHAR
jgi:tungstate transport system substrate-binding protein